MKMLLGNAVLDNQWYHMRLVGGKKEKVLFQVLLTLE